MRSIVVGVETRVIRNRVCIMDVLYMPKLQANLLSVNKLLSNELPTLCVQMQQVVWWSFDTNDFDI